jgi:hypothetical protein
MGLSDWVADLIVFDSQLIAGGFFDTAGGEAATRVAAWSRPDTDGDAQPDVFDNCPMIANPGQEDTEMDGVGDACDNCLAVINPNQSLSLTMTGDVNLSDTYTSADVVQMANYVFKGGAAPLPCPATGDVNCDGSVTSADIITLVNHVFKSGQAPCSVCAALGLGWSCP